MSVMNDKNVNPQLEELLHHRDAASRPIWVRAPKDGSVECFSGLGKGTLYALSAAGLIKTACLKRPGAVRGVRLFQLQSILDYIESRATNPPNHVTPSGGAGDNSF